MAYAILVSFLQGMGVVAFVAFAFEAIHRLVKSPSAQETYKAFVLASGVLATMTLPFKFAPGFSFDLRYVFLSLAAAHGGLPGLFLTTAAAELYRFHLGGVGAPAGMIGIAIGAVVGVAGARLFPRSLADSLAGSAALGALSSLSLLSLFLLPWATAVSVLQQVGLANVAINFMGIVGANIVWRHPVKVVALEENLRQEAAIDPLTGIYNRRAFSQLAPLLLDSIYMEGKTCGVVFVRLDGLMSVSDYLDLKMRDLVIQRASQIIRGNSPIGALVARVGPLEFASLLPVADSDRAEEIADAIRAELEREVFDLDDDTARITVEVAVKQTAGPGRRLDEILNRVDAILRNQKNSARLQHLAKSASEKAALAKSA